MKKKRIIIISALCLAGGLVWFITESRRATEIRNIVLISIDTCRADYLSCYGYPKNTTPNIDALAMQAAQFDYAITPVPMTLPAHCSMLTGMIPPAHGVHHNIGYQLTPANQTLAELLKQNGFQTGAIVSSFVLNRQFGLSQGFHTYGDAFKEMHRTRFGRERKGGETTEAALDWLGAHRDGKSFLFLHYYDPHEKYAPPEPFATKFADDPYAGEIAFVDHCIGRVIQKLKDLDLYDSTLLIITGDHGEMLGEHGEDEHGYFIYESAIKVPLIVKLPGQKTGAVITQKVGLIDIVPTICSLLKIDPPADIQGSDLSPMLHGRIPEGYNRYLYSESTGPNRIEASSLLGMTDGKWKYIQAPRPELYDLDADPAEEHNLVEQEPQRARILQDKLQETLELAMNISEDSRMDLDAESIRRLESLGYVAGKADSEQVFDRSGDDPKDFIHVFTQFNRALGLRDEKEYKKAEEILISLIPERPTFFEIYLKLAEIGMVQGGYDQAIFYYRRADILNLDKPLPDDLFNKLAWLQATRPLLMSRDVDEAVLYAKRSCQKTNYSDPYALDTLAVAYAATGDFPKAIETAQKAYQLSIDGKDFAFAKEISSRIELFKQSKPYTEQ